MASRSKTRKTRAQSRTLSSSETAYLRELELYEQVVELVIRLSLKQHGFDTDGRGVRASRIFTRQTLTALSFRKILPCPSERTHREDGLWDIGSIASLSRNLIEGYLALHYFGIEKISTEDAEFRFLLLQVHRNIEWNQIRRLTDANDPTIEAFEDGISKQKSRIKAHSFLPKLTNAQRSRALSGHEMYKTKGDFERELKLCKGLRRNYRMLSNLVHPLPLSIERIDNETGRGIGSDPDIAYCLICLVLARCYLAASAVEFADFFSEHFGPDCMNNVDSIRPLAFES